MPRALQIVGALERIAEIETGQSLSPAQAMKLLYYVQAIALAEDGHPQFDGTFEAWTHGPVEPEVWRFMSEHPDWRRLLMAEAPQLPEDAWERLREVYRVFGGLNAWELSQATHAERPWARARNGTRWDSQSHQPITETAIRDFYAEIVDDGEDAARELQLSPEEGVPGWALAYRLGVNLKRLAGHPFFDDEKSRRLRSALGLAEIPDRWTGDDFRPLEHTASELRGTPSA